jgi:ATP-dependent Clp protease ATP-binding subunit ClpA
VLEPTTDDAYKILKGLKSRFEEHHGLRYTDQALRVATELSARYITDRFLPGQGDRCHRRGRCGAAAAAALKAQEGRRQARCRGGVAKIARIPPKSVSRSDKEVLQKLESNLKMVVFGQDEAVSKLATSIKMARAGLRSGDKPIGSFLLAGPTGVGKTEVTRSWRRSSGSS